MTDPRPTTPTRQLEQESPQENLERERKPGVDEDPEASSRRRVLDAVRETGVLRGDELGKRIGYSEDPETWKQRLWRLHNEGYLKVRWVGLADPDPVEIRLTDRGREWLRESTLSSAERDPTPETAASAARAAGAAPPA